MIRLLAIARILFPLILVSIVVIFVVMRLKSKARNGTLGKKKTKQAQTMLDSLIPLGMLFGSLAAILLSLFLSIDLLSALPIGAATGFLMGYFAYEIYSKQE